MTHIRVTIDETVEFDGSVSEWKRKPPDHFKDQIKPGAVPKPWMKSIMIAIADAVMTKQSVNIDASTDMPTGWTVKVEYR